jgi:hypothetical protein
MKKCTIVTATIATLAATTVGFAGGASAAPTGTLSAADTVESLQAEGYSVQTNGAATEPLSQCTVTGVHGLDKTDSAGRRLDPTQFATVYVDISCPSDN